MYTAFEPFTNRSGDASFFSTCTDRLSGCSILVSTDRPYRIARLSFKPFEYYQLGSYNLRCETNSLWYLGLLVSYVFLSRTR